MPVLILEKSEHGNLHDFMSNKVGKRLSLAQRLQICLEIAEAVMYMHKNSEY